MQPVLILGAGINGAAVARELVLSGRPVCVCDTADVASGASSRSSRLIHGGLRYLEYGDWCLVRESLAERTRLLRLAPQFVRPLELFIPVEHRFTGALAAVSKLLGRPPRTAAPPRGLWLVRAGLSLYDVLSRGCGLPRHRALRADDPRAPAVDRRRFRWQCAYYDGAVLYPERFVLALLEDARLEAARQGLDFRVLTYREARLEDGRVEFRSTLEGDASAVPPSQEPQSLEPSAIVNATGAWVDATLARLRVPSRRLMGGTKGSHFVTPHRGLRDALGGRGVYAEAPDGRPVFFLPLGDHVLVGTTDVPFEGDPRDAVAEDAELDYLLEAVNGVFAPLRLARGDVLWHYSGVRPLPYADQSVPAAITRRHAIVSHRDCPLPLYSLVGGKLTTCRSLAEETAERVLRRLGLPRTGNSRQRPLPGGRDYPTSEQGARAEQARLAATFHLSPESAAALWRLYGTRTAEVLRAAGGEDEEPVPGTPFRPAHVRWMIRHEWVATLEDLVLRRLMLPYAGPLHEATWRPLAGLLVGEGRLREGAEDEAIETARRRLTEHYGIRTGQQA